MHSDPRIDTPGYRTQSIDTDEWAERLQFDRWRSMAAHEKARLLSELNAAAYRLQRIGLRQRHPDAPESELVLRAACTRIGREAVEQVLGRSLPFPEQE